MIATTVKSYADRRLDYASSYHVPQDTTYRTPVEVLEERYASHVQQTRDQKQILTLTRQRGDRVVTRKVTVTADVRRRLNRLLPKLREFCQSNGRFTAAHLAGLAGVKTVAANKYINILLALGFLGSDEKPWGATYTLRDERRYL